MMEDVTFSEVLASRAFRSISERTFVKDLRPDLCLVAELRPIPAKIRSVLRIKPSSFAVGLGGFLEWLPPVGGMDKRPDIDQLSDGHCWFRTDVHVPKEIRFEFEKLDIPSVEKARRDIWAIGSGVPELDLVGSFGKALDISVGRVAESLSSPENILNVLQSKESDALWGFGAIKSPVRQRLLDALRIRYPSLNGGGTWVEKVFRRFAP